jgi:hypothetical protein
VSEFRLHTYQLLTSPPVANGPLGIFFAGGYNLCLKIQKCSSPQNTSSVAADKSLNICTGKLRKLKSYSANNGKNNTCFDRFPPPPIKFLRENLFYGYNIILSIRTIRRVMAL